MPHIVPVRMGRFVALLVVAAVLALLLVRRKDFVASGPAAAGH